MKACLRIASCVAVVLCCWLFAAGNLSTVFVSASTPSSAEAGPDEKAGPTNPGDKKKKKKQRPKGRSHRQTMMAPSVSATMTDVLIGDIGIPGPSPGDTIEYRVNINNGGPDPATAMIYTNTIDIHTTLVPGSVKVSPVGVNDSYSVMGNVSISVPVGAGLLANDINPGGGLMTVSGVITAGTQGNVTFNADGSFTFNPSPGYTGTTSFDYIVGNGMLTDTGTVSLSVTNPIWFIDNSQPTNGDGRLGTPFNSIANFNSGASGGAASDAIFIYRQTATNYSGALTLKSGQIVIGQGASSSINTIRGISPPVYSASLPSTAGTRPVLANAGTTVTLNQNNRLHGFNIAASAGTGLLGSTMGTLQIRDMSVANTAGTAVSLTNGILDVELTRVDASNATKGLVVNTTTGTFKVLGTGSAGTGGTISSITQRGAEIITASNIELRSMNFTNANTEDAGASGVCDYVNTLACHGALYLRAVSGLILNGLVVNGSEEQGLNGRDIVNMTMSNCAFSNNGDEQEEGAVKIRNLSGNCSITNSSFTAGHEELVDIYNPSGAAALTLNITNSQFTETQVSAHGERGLWIEFGNSVTSTVNVDDCDFTRIKSQGVRIQNTGSGHVVANVTDCEFDRQGGSGSGITYVLEGTGSMDVNANRNTINMINDNAVTIEVRGSSTMRARVNNNTISGPGDCELCFGDGIFFNAQGTSQATVEAVSNTINGLDIAAYGIRTIARENSTMHARVQNNVITLAGDSFYGIESRAGQTTTGTETAHLCTYVIGNTINGTGLAHWRVRVANASASVNLQGTGANAATIWANNGNSPLPGTISQSITAGGTITFGNTCNQPVHATAVTVPDLFAANEQVGETVKTDNPEINQQLVELLSADDEPGSGGYFAGGGSRAGETVTVGAPTGFTLPGSKNIRVEYRVTINPDIPAGVCAISNQGTVTGSNFASVLTDDPDIAGAANPTVTQLESPPSITLCPANVTLDTDDDLCTASHAFAASVDGCPFPTVTYDLGGSGITSPYAFPVGSNVVVVTASNGTGSDAICSFTVVVEDNQAPVLTCLVGTQNRGVNTGVCTYTVSGSEFNPSIDENCAGYTVTNDFNGTASLAGALLPLGTTTVVFTITDAGGQTASCSVVIQVSDTQAPAISCPGAISVQCSIDDVPPYADLEAFLTAGGSASDNCQLDTASFRLVSEVESGSGCNLLYTRTYAVDDMAGNSNSCVQQVSVSDTTAPVITTATGALDVTLDCADAAGIAAALAAEPAATDNCSETVTIDLISDVTNATCPSSYERVRQWVFTDDCGNESDVYTQTIVVQDTVSPELQCVSSIDVFLDEDGEATVQSADLITDFTDNCSAGYILTGQTIYDYDCSDLGTMTTATVSVTDSCGNPASCIVNITVLDTLAPVLTCNATASYSVSVIGTCDFEDYIENEVPYPGVTDNCDGAPAIEVNIVLVDSICEGVPGQAVYNATYTATDDSGNTAQCTVAITFTDDVPPVITCQSVTVELDENGEASITAGDVTGSVTDQCVTNPADFTYVVNRTDFDCGDIGNNTVILTITDCGGNSASCTALVVVEDNILPGITCPANITVECSENGGNPTDTSYTGIAIVTDNCTASFTYSDVTTPGDCPDDYTITRTFLAVDVLGNEASCSQTITVIDTTAPVIEQAPGELDVIIECNDEEALEDALALFPSATDNCSSVTMTLTDSTSVPGLCAGAFVITRVWSFTDECDNVSTYTQVITAGDFTPPVVVCTDATVSLDSSGVATVTADDVFDQSASSDNCGPIIVDGISQTSFDCSDAGTSTIVTVSVSDECGNTASCTSTVTVVDDMPPVISYCPSDITVDADVLLQCGTILADYRPEMGVYDNCGIESFTQTPLPGSNLGIGEYTVSFVVTDSSGLVSTCNFDLTVNGWLSTDLGGSVPGSAFYNESLNTATVIGSGTNTPTTQSDKGHFLYYCMCGDAEIVTRVNSVNNGGKAGAMMRETLEPGSRKASILTPLSGTSVYQQNRSVTNGNQQEVIVSRPNAKWIRIKRVSNSFRGYVALDAPGDPSSNATWILTFNQTISMDECYYLGLYTIGRSDVLLSTGTFGYIDYFATGSRGQEAEELPFEGLPEQFSMLAYPTVTNYETNIRLTSDKQGIGLLRVFNALGQPVAVEAMSYGHNDEFIMHVDNWTNGMYILSFEAEGKILATQKIIVQH